MRLTILGGCGAWPAAGRACSGYLVEQDGFRLLIDPGYATVPHLLELIPAGLVDAVFVSHGHPDHCADLNPLLRARTLHASRGRTLDTSQAPTLDASQTPTSAAPQTPALDASQTPTPDADASAPTRDARTPDADPAARAAYADLPTPLPVYSLPGAVDAVLALDRPGMLTDAYVLHEFTAGDGFEIGPFRVQTRLLPHWLPNAGVRLTAGSTALAYTGDTGPSQEVVSLARGADLLLAEASYVDMVPEDSRQYLTSARQAGRQATEAGVERLLLTHLFPDTDEAAARSAAAAGYSGEIDIATSGLVVELP
jgi:ribonuclease BN (tRNA processing enzyme)